MISAVVLAKNEEDNIERCLKSLFWADEILVIDDNSIDKTSQIAGLLRAKIISRSLNNNFSQQRNFALENARGEWVLFVDADEEISVGLQKEIKSVIVNSKNCSGFYFKRHDLFFNKWLRHGEIGSVRLLRLAQKNAGVWEREVDEIWKIKGQVKTLVNPLLHYPHPNLDQFLKSINIRSTLNAKVFYDQKRKNTIFDWIKPILKFKYNYILRLGFLDGIEGFIFAVMMSLHSYMVRAKVHMLWRKNNGTND